MTQDIPAPFAANPFPDYLNEDDRTALSGADRLRHDDGTPESPCTLLAIIAQSKLDAVSATRGETLDLAAARRAMAWLHESACRGVPTSALRLAHYYMSGDAGIIDRDAAAFWFDFIISRGAGSELAKDDDIEPLSIVRRSAMTTLSTLLSDPEYGGRDLARSMALCREAAALGDITAHWNLFVMLSCCGVVPHVFPDARHIDEAFESLGAAAIGGIGPAQALMSEYAEAAKRSDDHAMAWLCRQLWDGIASARYRLILLLCDPEGAAHDTDEALARLGKLIEVEDWPVLALLDAQLLDCKDAPLAEIGRLIARRMHELHGYPWTLNYIASLMRGDGGDRDIPQALRLLAHALETPPEEARRHAQLHALVSDIRRGTCGESWRDDDTAMAHLLSAASLGDPASAFNLGLCLAHGRHGLKKDVFQAARWYRKAAEAGNIPASTNLAFMVLRGDIEGDPEEAICALIDAEEAGDERASDAVEAILDAQNRAQFPERFG